MPLISCMIDGHDVLHKAGKGREWNPRGELHCVVEAGLTQRTPTLWLNGKVAAVAFHGEGGKLEARVPEAAWVARLRPTKAGDARDFLGAKAFDEAVADQASPEWIAGQVPSQRLDIAVKLEAPGGRVEAFGGRMYCAFGE